MENLEKDGRNNKGQFTKGRTVPTEENIKKQISLIDSWKKREDYIGDLIKENPYIYNVWRGIRFTQKGKKVGNEERWNNFKNFYNDVVSSYEDGKCFRRINLEDNYNKNNFIWLTHEEESCLRNTVKINYNGESLSLKELSIKYNQSYTAIKNRYHKREKYNYTIEEIIFGRTKKRGNKKPKDFRDISQKHYDDPKQDPAIRAKASKMISSYKIKDKKNGTTICDIDIDWMIDNILTKRCSYCGDNHRIGCDRIDNSKGHTKDNVVPCCYECNCARNNNFSYEETQLIGKAIYLIKKHRYEPDNIIFNSKDYYDIREQIRLGMNIRKGVA